MWVHCLYPSSYISHLLPLVTAWIINALGMKGQQHWLPWQPLKLLLQQCSLLYHAHEYISNLYLLINCYLWKNLNHAWGWCTVTNENVGTFSAQVCVHSDSCLWKLPHCENLLLVSLRTWESTLNSILLYIYWKSKARLPVGTLNLDDSPVFMTNFQLTAWVEIISSQIFWLGIKFEIRNTPKGCGTGLIFHSHVSICTIETCQFVPCIKMCYKLSGTCHVINYHTLLAGSCINSKNKILVYVGNNTVQEELI